VRRRDVLACVSAAGVVALTPFRVLAQAASPPSQPSSQSWPTSNIIFVSPFTPGGMSDVLGRALAEKLTLVLGRSVIVDNRAGAGGTIGATSVARSTPDGTTLLIGHIGILAVNPSLYANLQYAPLTSFAFVAPLALVPNVLVINPAIPVTTIAELIAYAKANPGKLNFSSAGIGGAAHIAMAAFNLAAGIDTVHVPYRGTPPSINDVISGQVHLTFTSGVSLLPHVRNGTLRALGVGTLKRLPAAPDIPAIAETVPNFECSSWYGVVAPTGTPEPIVQRLYTEIRKAMASPDIAKRLNTEGAEHWDVSPAEFRRYVAVEIERWKVVIDAANIKIQ
jgi:tripartite-type tricarboxylate transporter receptor subunit TctC